MIVPPIHRILDLSDDLYANGAGAPEFPAARIELLLNAPRDGWTLELLTTTLHQATHLDAPSHIVDTGISIDRIPIDRFQGKAVVVDLRRKRPSEPIAVADLQPYASLIEPDTIPLLATGWCRRRAWTVEYCKESPYVTVAAARWLVERRVRAVAIDHFSIGGRAEENEETHRTLLAAGLWIAEGLLLPDELFERPVWHLMAFPVRIRDASGAPARVIAIEYDEV